MKRNSSYWSYTIEITNLCSSNVTQYWNKTNNVITYELSVYNFQSNLFTVHVYIKHEVGYLGGKYWLWNWDTTVDSSHIISMFQMQRGLYYDINQHFCQCIFITLLHRNININVIFVFLIFNAINNWVSNATYYTATV